MKKLLILGNFLLFTLVLRAQNDYFLFIQSENNQPYYVQTNGKTLSSSGIGHLIISGLRDSVYQLSIGFPKNQFPEQLFQLQINKKDAGYQLKNLGAEGWALFNIQTLQLIKAQPVESTKQTISYGDIKRTDVFSTLMAGLVNDSAVLYTSIAKAEPAIKVSNTGIPDTPLRNNRVLQKDESIRADTLITKSEVAKPQEIPQKDTSLVRAEAGKQEDVKKDSLIGRLDTIKQQDPIKGDTLVTKSEPAKSQELPKADTLIARTEIIKQETVPKKDTPVNNNILINDQKAAEDSLSKLQPVPSKSADVQFSELKPLIIFFSETKTSGGTELVFFDMSVADRIDTIRILIPKEELTPVYLNGQEGKKDTVEEKKEDQKPGAGKFLGKIFGKKNKPETAKDEADKTKAEANKSSIKVTTVEDKKPAGSEVARTSKKGESTSGVIEIKSDQKANAEPKGSGKLFGKLFGKKNNEKSARVDTTDKTTAVQNASTVKVTNVENKSADSAVVKNKYKADESMAEVEKLKKDQENAEKTSTERFFGKLFGKKNKAKSSKDNTDNSKVDPGKNASSIKVTTIERRSAAENKEKSKVVVSNSDCREIASDYDVDKLRVRMLGEKDADGQITEARKLFKVKCFTTKQIQSLSTLFRTDEGKYKLLDAAYPFVSDTNNFKELVTLLSEEYYINRFKAMVRM
jgi:branched-subunit amino acid transport protein AzlD